MSKEIEIKYKWDRETFLEASKATYDFELRHSPKRFLGWFFIAMTQFGVVAALKKDAIGLLLFSSIVLVYWYYGKKMIARRRVRKSFEHSPFKDRMIHIDAGDEGLDIRGNEGDIHWDWEDIDDIISLDDAVMIYRHPDFHYIPASGFASLEEKSRFKSMAKKHHKLSGR
jgi:hypothetical protein